MKTELAMTKSLLHSVESETSVSAATTFSFAAKTERPLRPDVREAFLAMLDHAGRELGGGKLLDVGNGARPLRSEIQKRHLRYANFAEHESEKTETAFVGSIEGSLPTGLRYKAPFDFITCVDQLGATADWPHAFANFNQLLRNRGYLLVSVPFFQEHDEGRQDYWRPTPQAILHFAAEHGFEWVEIRKVGGPLDVLAELSRYMHSHLVPVMTRGPVDHLFVRARKILLRFILKRVARWASGGFFDAHFSHSSHFYLNTLVLLRKKS